MTNLQALKIWNKQTGCKTFRCENWVFSHNKKMAMFFEDSKHKAYEFKAMNIIQSTPFNAVYTPLFTGTSDFCQGILSISIVSKKGIYKLCDDSEPANKSVPVYYKVGDLYFVTMPKHF